LTFDFSTKFANFGVKKMADEKFIMFRNRLTKVFRHLGRQAKRLHVSCYRIYDHDLPEFPFCIEIYEDKLYVAEYKRHHGLTDEQYDDWIGKSIAVMSEVIHVDPADIFLKQRKVKSGRTDQYKKTAEAKNEFVVHENNLKFIVNLSDYLDTGLFLDHRVTREMVKNESAGKKVLNLFCYTGSFSVYAAAGGASEIISVDLSKTYLNWAERNMQLNEFANNAPCATAGAIDDSPLASNEAEGGTRLGDGGKYQYIHVDVLKYVKMLPSNYFDIVILDPPTFSNSQRMDQFLDIQRDHVKLINDCLNGLKKDGVLYFSTNSRKFILDKEKIRAGSIKDITKATTPFDFVRKDSLGEGKLFRWCFRIER
jgi:23S rRNA (guanine2069-N7)-methyltransferase